VRPHADDCGIQCRKAAVPASPLPKNVARRQVRVLHTVGVDHIGEVAADDLASRHGILSGLRNGALCRLHVARDLDTELRPRLLLLGVV
jgi:hypothetical protein